MDKYTKLAFSLREMDDISRASAIRELDQQISGMQTVPSSTNDESIKPPYLSSPSDCVTARMVLRSVTDAPCQPLSDTMTDEAEKHVNSCAACAQWHRDGRPFVFNMTMQSHRDCFCRLIRTVLRYENEWPLSYQEAFRHCEHCSECKEWQHYFKASLSCETTRGLLKPRKRRLAYCENDNHTEHLDRHVQDCEDCQRWCFSETSCTDIRRYIRWTIAGNEREHKVHHHESLGTIEHYHLLLCEDCRYWVFENRPLNTASAPVYEILRNNRQCERRILPQTGSIQFRRPKYRSKWDIIHEDADLIYDGIELGSVEFEMDQDPADILIEDVGFSIRTTYCLRGAGIRRLGDITRMTLDELSSIRNLGRKCVDEILQTLDSYGLKLKNF